MQVSTRLTRYIESRKVPSGDLAGQPMRVFPWERRLLKLFNRPGDIALSLGRGNGKTAFLGAIAAGYIQTGLAQPGSDVLIVAASHGQARIAFGDVLAFLRQTDPLDRKRWRVNDSQQHSEARFLETGARVRVIGSDPKKAHGLRPCLTLADEPAQWDPGKTGAMVAALRTAAGKVKDSRIVWLGTYPAAGTGHFFETELKMEDAIVYRADEEDDPWKVSTWHKANPSLRWMPELRATLEKEAKRAKVSPEEEASFRALRLNQGGSGAKEQLLVEAATWAKAERRSAPRDGAPVVAVDLATTAMAGVAAVWPSGACDAFGSFPRNPSLVEIGRRHNVGQLYHTMSKRGELIQTGTTTVDIVELLEEIVHRWGVPSRLVCDRWRHAELVEALTEAAFPPVPILQRGMGFMDGGEDIRAFHRALSTEWLAAPKSLLVRHAMSVSRTQTDPAGNLKFVQRGPKKRDDAAVALVLATRPAYLDRKKTKRKRRWAVA